MSLLILVVDDEPDVETLFRQQFRRDLCAGRIHDGFCAIGRQRAQTHQCKAKAARPDVPVIIITAYGDADTKQKALEAGAEALLTKPIDFVALRDEIDNRVAGTGAAIR